MPTSRSRSPSTASMLRLSAVLALLPLNCVHAISSHSPLDLLAFPAYSVKLNPGNPIANSSAERILAGDENVQAAIGGRHTAAMQAAAMTPLVNEVQQFGHTAQDGAGMGANAFASNTLPTKSFLMRASGNGQAYLCSVPQHAPPINQARDAADVVKEQSLTKAEKEERRKKAEDDRRQAYERGLALLEPLKGTCLYLTQGWFTCALLSNASIQRTYACLQTLSAMVPKSGSSTLYACTTRMAQVSQRIPRRNRTHSDSSRTESWKMKASWMPRRLAL